MILKMLGIGKVLKNPLIRNFYIVLFKNSLKQRLTNTENLPL